MVFHDEVDQESSTELTLASCSQQFGDASFEAVDVEEPRKPIAHFDRSEVKLGKQIGEGYFSKVYEINGFQLDHHGNDHYYSPEEQELRQAYHQQVADANGSGRFVLKHLKPRLLQAGRNDFENAVVDLVAEATFLQQLQHPNILSLKGLARGGTDAFRGGTYESYFLITERLSETLAQRIHRWRKQLQKGGTDKNDGSNKTTSTQRLGAKCHYALQIAQALRYLHHHQLIFRDVKTDNIGFAQDDPDKIQLFDFGLCRKLPESNQLDDVFRMSGGVGTRRYCAVEVCRHQPYNAKADTYSWGIVFWELLTLQKPFADFTKEDHYKFVCELGGTPNLSRHSNVIPPSIQTMLRHCWARNVSKRWTMAQVCDSLQDIIHTDDDLQYPRAAEPRQDRLALQQHRQSSFVWRGTRRRSKVTVAA
ncbi:Probable LIM domain-containing serine/threonine-protein kinase DDB [Seminavis robusta]|uniref:Probable LIM domain-containing serine/threonine-protein kinase DDB n=1 Tax=Seminavis robusta TaxID=568900 RepID=A0A9N8EV98_9STRA|nr:Probable LIM domain-containing serine/threonine-protein kinase DDB [Seminavis robusta]|eukprot:Sro2098_g314420.1 Probable LIM domain-containing serine/threonine-protein kinase DDB (421) ;mRNA; r:14288-15550